MSTRAPAVAGRFYPDKADQLDQQLTEIRSAELKNMNLELARKKILGAIVPHAGYIYSAYQAIHFFEILKQSGQRFDTFFIINPNHTGYGPEVALDANSEWVTPYGKVEIDSAFHQLLNIPESGDAHRYEHSGEVMLPLLQYSLDYPFKIVPITMFRQTTQHASSIARAIVEANNQLKKKICVIASSDFSHFVEPDEGERLDRFVIDNILTLNSEGIFREVHEKHITVCGYGPIMTLVEYARLAGRDPRVSILKKGHSGEIHHSSEVVDYVSALFYDNDSE